MAADINIGVGMDLTEFSAGTNTYIEGIRFISQQTQAAIADFAALEAQANELGTTVQAVAGISTDVAASYQDLASSSSALETALRSLRISALSPAVSILDDVTRSAANAGFAVKDFFAGTEDAADKSSLFKFIAGGSTLGITSLFDLVSGGVGSRFIRPDDETLRQRGIAQDRLAAAEEQAEFSAFTSRVERQRQFDLFQGIDRNSFLENQRIQRLNRRGGLPFSELLRQQEAQLAQFDIRQRSAALKNDIRSGNETDAATIATEKNTKRTSEGMQALLEEFRAFNNGARFIDKDVTSVLEDI